ncbi:MAG TPA: hypothetical protein VK508_07080 [Cyclobacteriaceae bacterium]|nr:hypothetical protein [Cyclobacteriaceae bacterium]
MLNFTLKGLLTRDELQREKTKDYRNIVIIQIIIVVFGLTLSEPLLADSRSPQSKLIITLFSFFGAAYAFLLWDLLRNFTTSRKLLVSIIAVLSGIVVTGILVEFPYYQILEVTDRRTYLLVIHGLLFPIEITVISFAIRDLFSGGFFTADKLWGAACIYLMIGISFGSLYDLISIAVPGSLGAPIELGLPNYAECVSYSLGILGGVDAGLLPSRLIRNISILEAVWGSIYGMLIIGKLLGLPRDETSNNQQPINK